MSTPDSRLHHHSRRSHGRADGRIVAPGGFNGITDNPTFTGQGKTIDIKVTVAASGSGESPPSPATLTYQRADGASRTFDGSWRCGP